MGIEVGKLYIAVGYINAVRELCKATVIDRVKCRAIVGGIGAKYGQVMGAAQKQGTTTASNTIDNNTPLNSKEVFFVVATAYALGMKKQVIQKVRDPFIPGLMHTFTAGKNGGSTGIQLSW